LLTVGLAGLNQRWPCEQEPHDPQHATASHGFRERQSRPSGTPATMKPVPSSASQAHCSGRLRRVKGDGEMTSAMRQPAIYRHSSVATFTLSRRRPRVRVPSLPFRSRPHLQEFRGVPVPVRAGHHVEPLRAAALRSSLRAPR
jgi:hypothetical protein